MKYRLLAALILFYSGLHAQQLTLKQCIDTALKNNIQVQQSGLQKQTASINNQQAKMNLLPAVNGSWNYGFNFGRNVDPITNTFTNNQLESSNPNVNAGVVLFNGMRLQNLLQQANYNYKAAAMDYKQAQDNLVLNVILAYMQILVNEDLIAASKAQLAVTQKQVERMDVLVKEGSAGSFQLTDMKGQMANEQINLVNLENSLQQSKLSLCQLMNIPYAAALTLERNQVKLNDAVYAQSSAEVIAAAMEYMALIKANEYRVKSAEKNRQVAKGAYFPTISLTGAMGSGYSSFFRSLTPTSVVEENTGLYTKNGSVRTPVFTEVQKFNQQPVGYFTQMKNNIGYFAGLSVQVPIFNNLQARNRIKLADINYKNVQLDAQNTHYQLRQNIEQAWLNMNASYKRYSALQEQVTNFEESFRAATVRFENGVINAVEFLLVKNNFDRSTINLIQAKYEYTFRTKLLDFYQGRELW